MPTLKPVPEQQRAAELFLAGGNLRIDAYAGTGKTTTLLLLAANKQCRGMYLAFNKSIAVEARQRFPAHVKCATTHSVAFRGVRRNLGYPEWKLTEALTPNLILEAFRLPATVSFHSGAVLERRSYAAILRDGLKLFLQSSDRAPGARHVPRYGVLEALSPGEFESFAAQVGGHLGYLWASMMEREKGLPLGHDGYLKLWVLCDPQARADYIMVEKHRILTLCFSTC